MTVFARSGVLVALSFAAVACSTVPVTIEESPREVPDWVIAPPAGTNGIEYFVASGSDGSGDVSAAQEQAASALLLQINQALGVDISFLTTAEARASRDSYEATITEQIVQSGSGRIQGLRIEDRFLVTDEDRVTVHVLGAYERTAFEAERRARESLIAAQEALYLQPEQEAARAITTGNPLEAARLYLIAAEAASRAPESLASAAPARDRTLQAAAAALRGVSVAIVSGPREVQAGSVIEEPIVIRLLREGGEPIAGGMIEIATRGDGATPSTVRRASLRTDSSGTAQFTLARPERAGRILVTARIQSTEMDQYLRALPQEAGASRAAIQAELARIGAQWEVVASSRAQEIATTVMILETGRDGEVSADASTEAGVVDALIGAGFPLVEHGVTDRVTVAPSTAAIRSAVESAGTGAQRAIIGTASIAEVSEPDGFLVRVRGQVTVVDLSTNEIVYATSGIKNARSATLEQAINVALYQLGMTLGEDLISRMP